ncbi:hypothetical protein [Aquimarina spongiae]|uniref:Uncharacterized protein n=1 Tax=Aquimarina spongiae TaxID=570521 RepID=A0A1M6D3A3_9FLAO|nr:hypothetical protein [Aquimarina spongiae]SHI67730.1 hypothetical protein SAMN04488508_102416 [Aquimarina spongiae]
MVFTHKIESYNIKIISNYAEGGGYQMGYVYLYGENSKYLGCLGIIKNDKALPKNKLKADKTFSVYFHESGLQTILNTFKQQNPIFIQFDSRSLLASLMVGKYEENGNDIAA